MACAQAQQAGQSPEEIAKQALTQVQELDGKFNNITTTVNANQEKSIQNAKTIEEHSDKIKEIENNKQEIQKIGQKVTTELEASRNIKNGINQKVDEAVKKVDQATESVKKIENEAKEQIADIKRNKEKLKELSEKADVFRLKAVSYTHLTLPTTERV